MTSARPLQKKWGIGRSTIKISDNTTLGTIFDKPGVKIVTKEVCKDVNMNSHTGKPRERSLLNDNDDDGIPLIDSQAEPEEIRVFMENITERPKIIIKTVNMCSDRSGSNSLEIFT